jgi:hypothetical protein
VTSDRDGHDRQEHRRRREEQRIRDEEERALRPHHEQPPRVASDDVTQAPPLGGRDRELRRDGDDAAEEAEATCELHVLAEVARERIEASCRFQRRPAHAEELADEAVRINPGQERKRVERRIEDGM